jgi:hypothetical protein
MLLSFNSLLRLSVINTNIIIIILISRIIRKYRRVF